LLEFINVIRFELYTSMKYMKFETTNLR